MRIIQALLAALGALKKAPSRQQEQFCKVVGGLTNDN